MVEGIRYDSIGVGYAAARRPDPRIAATIRRAIGTEARSLVNVGAGTGNYEPSDLQVTAAEPSTVMIEQRPRGSAPVVRAVAEALPFTRRPFDVALAVLTVHHWADLAAGLAELRRVADRQVVLYFDRAKTGEFWLSEYFPEALDVPSERHAPGLAELQCHLDIQATWNVPVPHDCTDGFGEAYWARPEAYLDREVQRGMSWLARLPGVAIDEGTARLRQDLASGLWDERHGHLRDMTEYDGGYRIAIARTSD